MDATFEATHNPTDPSGLPQSKGKHRTGKGSQQKRTDNFRRKKNEETFAAIQAGIFARLKIRDPTGVSQEPLACSTHAVVAPITFRNLPTFVDRVWDKMQAIGTRPFAALDNPQNRAIFKKGMLILSEVKLCYAQRKHGLQPDEDLPSRKLYSDEELRDMNRMASELPYPLAIYLECIGVCVDDGQPIIPVLAELQSDALNAASGAMTFAPRQLLPLLNLLRDGVPANQEVHQVAMAISDLPNLGWEEFEGPANPPNMRGPPMVRISQASFDFWTRDNGRRIRWTDEEYRTFTQIVKSLSSKKGFNVSLDLSPGEGSLAQVVQTIDWSVEDSIAWFTMTNISEFDRKIGAAFGFCDYQGNEVQPSRFRGCWSTSYWRGEITPRRILSAILSSQE